MGTTPSSESEIIRVVRWRHRIYRYQQITGAIWTLVGCVGYIFAMSHDRLRFSFLCVLLVGVAINTTAYAVALAVYRCPACDRRLSVSKDRCPGCGVRVR
jgi:hypothetical protein